MTSSADDHLSRHRAMCGRDSVHRHDEARTDEWSEEARRAAAEARARKTGSSTPSPRYNPTEVNKAIARDPRIKGKEARAIHALLKGRHDDEARTDPPVSEAQRRAMWAAKSGNSTLGIPKSVGTEFANADPGGKLPEHK